MSTTLTVQVWRGRSQGEFHRYDEFGSDSGLRKNWIAGTAGFAAIAGMAFALSLLA